MTESEFLNFLQNKRFPEPILVTQPPNGHLDKHAHPFEVYALIIEGFIVINIDGKATQYNVGEIFHLDYLQNHIENYGPLGVKYLTSKIEPSN